MPKSLTVYSALIISPGDVADEREAIVKMVGSWNAHVGAGLNVRVDPVRWESHARPEMGGTAQAQINRQIVDDCDFGIAIFWSRLGSPTTEHASGSAEEIHRLLQRGCKVMVYFSSKAIPQSALHDDQFNRLMEAKQRYQEQGLLASYEGVADLREKVQLHLTSLVSELLQGEVGAGPIPSTGTLTAPMPDVRVRVQAGFAVGGGLGGHMELLSVTVENHSPNPFFLSSIVFECTDGDQMYAAVDAATGEYQHAKRIEPGDSHSFHVNPHLLTAELKGRTLVAAMAKDKIGRAFRSAPGQLAATLSSFGIK